MNNKNVTPQATQPATGSGTSSRKLWPRWLNPKILPLFIAALSLCLPTNGENEESKCPVTGMTQKHAASKGTSNQDWWPNQLNLKILHQNSAKGNRWARILTTPRNSKSSTCRP